MRASLFGECGEILLTGFERIHFGSGRTLRIHREPDRPDDDAHHAGGDVLRDLGVILVGEPFGLDVVRLDLGADHGAIALRVLRLHDGHRMRVAPRASRQGKGQCSDAELPAMQDTHLHQPQRKKCSLNVLYDYFGNVTLDNPIR